MPRSASVIEIAWSSIVPSTESKGSCECKSIVASRSRFSCGGRRERAGTGKVLDTAENVLNGSVGPSGSEDDFVGILDAKANDVAVLQFAAIDLLSTHKDAAAVAPVFEIPQVALGDKRGTLTGDAAVGKLEMIPALAASKYRRAIR